ncbi:CapA family protein [Candidatus Palauibacter sp.]|uniref:CapA family protein n=1 Tax=Candidatus Palauibacter sp. TaxID=3101350 RepID=UPI003B026AE8
MRRNRLPLLSITLAGIAAGLALAAGTGLTTPTALEAQAFEDASGNMSIALAGDAIISRKMSPYREPEFLALRDIIRNATTAFVNLEILFHDYEDDVIPAAASGGTYMRAEPEIAHELAWFGFDMVSLANNHTMDFGAGGARRTVEATEAAGLAVAGYGENLAQARAPVYVETPGGRVALISIASTFDDAMRAGHQRPDMRGRPGLSPIRYDRHVTVTADQMAGLRDALSAAGRGGGAGPRLSFGGMTFTVGDKPGMKTVPHAGDLAEIVEVVKEAQRQAEWVIVTSHSHEGGERRDLPADFLVDIARASVDAGADMFVGHGPHILRAVELYQGKPIFYSLANFAMQNETVELQPQDNYEAQGLGFEDHPGMFQDVRIERMGAGSFPAGKGFWESVVPVVEYEDGKLAEIKLYPITMGWQLPRPVRGRPMLADDALGKEILEGLAQLSAEFGTTMTIEDGVGVIRP